MKNLYLLFTALLTSVNLSLFASSVDLPKARLAGLNYFYERSLTDNPVPFSSLQITGEFVISEQGSPVYYVFNISDRGFIIISAEDACYPVIGYSFEGRFDPGIRADNFNSWMEKCKQEILLARESNAKPGPETAALWDQLTTTDPSKLQETRGILDVPPLITATWNQDFPYNTMCPADVAAGGTYYGHVMVGCVATAMGMIMEYWRWPQQGTGSHCISPVQPEYGQQCADFGQTTYEFNGMSGSPAQECDPVALLSWHAGISVDMDYGPDVSLANVYNVAPALKGYFKYASTTTLIDRANYSPTDWKNALKSDLDQGQPMVYVGSGPGGGHAWICDGYQGEQFHMNWGWGGSYNGYFTLDNLNPGGYTYDSLQMAIVHIKPDPSLYPLSCTGTTHLSAYTFGSIEDGSGPVASYADNTSCSWLIAPDDSISTVTLTFSRFATEPGDEVKVYDGSDATAPLIGTYSGTTVPSGITSTGPSMFLTFTTNGSGNAQGWLADYQGNPIDFCETNTTLTGATGEFSDGSGRFGYRNSSNCKWKIQPDNATTVTLEFTSFETEADKDMVQVFDLASGALLGTYSGEYPAMPDPVTASSGKMMVIWNSNNSVRKAGWEASYTTTVGTDETDRSAGFTVFPNPAGDRVRIAFDLPTRDRVTLEVLTMQGIPIFTESLLPGNGNSISLDVSGWSRGVYVIRVISGEETAVRKIVLE